MLKAAELRGVWATVLLDIREDGSPRLDCIEEQTSFLAKAGCDGIYCNGTATEFHCQDDATCGQVMQRTVRAARATGLPVQLGAAHPLPHGSLDRVAMAAALRPDAIQVTLPDWTPIDLETALSFLTACAEAASGCPLVLYNPPHAKTVLSPSQLEVVADAVPALIGLKCGGGGTAWYAQMRPVLERWSVFIPGHFYASGVGQGAHGAYSNMVCLNPSGAVRWAATCRSTPDAAADIEQRIARFMEEAIAPILASGTPGYACDKAMAAAGGWAQISSRLMWPYHGATIEDVERIRLAADRWIPDFMERDDGGSS
ncbi:dihydrodipicolinate synthase family protein [Tropicimonas sp. IMCC6043]|uniref:dihydrodipicolinate synthase family protein n=1 Tax=Tropicimonas sp. IMCC6043 TaxID=2510645 RepID=UPI00101CE1E6|nr:dihydrodipicolinate synthase family protein [Tropicimonas sp. IMCC6043]RYH07874.1 dihydrodipicolinate synthase family protein [Tropicimonas sp. IMCC6043]